ncbi:MAG: TorF family putative porin [Gemmatimonadales bacterium]
MSLVTTIATVVALPFMQAPSPHALSGNLTLVGDYRFRGLSQTYRQPAIQGGAEYGAVTGAYAGAWGSNVSGNQFLNGGSLELDLYGGYRWSIGTGGIDVGAQYYWYPRARYNIDPGDRYNTTELYLGVRYDRFTAKYSHALSDLFGMKTRTIGGYCGVGADGTPATTNCLGTGASTGSGYLDLLATFGAPKVLSVALHYGYQSVRRYERLSYSDYKIALARALGPVTLGAAAVGTDAEARFYRFAPTTAGSGETENVAKLGVVLSASRAF